MVGVERRPDAGQVHPAHRLNEGKVLRQVSLNGDTGLRQAELPGGLHQRSVPVASIALILGVDHFMSEVRALTNRIGNGVATVVVAKWEGALDMEALRRHLDGETDAEADDPEAILVEHDEDLMDAEALGGAGAAVPARQAAR